jgi:hypothetical protein
VTTKCIESLIVGTLKHQVCVDQLLDLTKGVDTATVPPVSSSTPAQQELDNLNPPRCPDATFCLPGRKNTARVESSDTGRLGHVGLHRFETLEGHNDDSLEESNIWNMAQHEREVWG